ncbi:MAG: hypothetical protein ACHQQR_05275 [Gemmatimonadales bacterium]
MMATHDSIERAACAARLSAAALRVEKAALRTRINAEERWGKHRALEIAAWGAVFVVWIAAIAVMGKALGWS